MLEHCKIDAIRSVPSMILWNPFCQFGFQSAPLHADLDAVDAMAPNDDA
jgi:hypothetical protein